MFDGRTNTVTFFTVTINKKKSLILMISGQTPLLILPLSVTMKESFYKIDARRNTSLFYYHNGEEKSLILMM